MLCLLSSTLVIAVFQYYHGEASYFSNSYVELPQVQQLLSNNWKLGNWRPALLHEVQVPLHPNLPLWLWTQLVQPRDAFAAQRGVGIWFLMKNKKTALIIEWKKRTLPQQMYYSFWLEIGRLWYTHPQYVLRVMQPRFTFVWDVSFLRELNLLSHSTIQDSSFIYDASSEPSVCPTINNFFSIISLPLFQISLTANIFSFKFKTKSKV